MLYRKCILLILSVLLTGSLFAQGYINNSRTKAMADFRKYQKQNDSLPGRITETDSTLVLTVDRSAKNYSMEVVLHFDQEGKCDLETHISGCDSCFQKYMSDVVNNEKYGWVKTGPAEYVSKFSKHRYLHVSADGPFTYIIGRLSLTRKEYEALLERSSGSR